MKNIIEQISNKWFLSEPLLFNVLCSHKLVENPDMLCPIRCGERRIEYNTKLLEKSLIPAEELLKGEIYRILLKHPYERLPLCPNHNAMLEASNITISESCSMKNVFKDSDYYKLKGGQCYEEYYNNLKYIIPRDEYINMPSVDDENDSDSDNEGTGQISKTENIDPLAAGIHQSALWGEDEKMKEKINSIITQTVRTNQWGSVGDFIREKIIPKKFIKMNYVDILRRFKTTIMQTRRTLTRLRPNRRYGYEYMGSKYSDDINLLVAVDVSGSISKDDLQRFFGIINRFFKYGIKEIKLLTFDVGIKQEMDFRKPNDEIKILGRGGTSFQEPVDYLENNSAYAGMIIFTDGCAPVPILKKPENILWILNDKRGYKYANWIKTLPGSRMTWIDK